MIEVCDIVEGAGPLVVSMPHSGKALADGMAERMTSEALRLPDTDWHVPRLYDFLDELRASVIQANYSRYVVDLNRDPAGVSLYPGQTTTGLVPVETFDGLPVYLAKEAPGEAEVDARTKQYFRSYHSQLSALLDRAVEVHGYALLWDAHSIASQVPRLFEGELPALNLGTNSGASCAADVRAAAGRALGAADFSHVVDGRFRGGWITRHYGQPARHVHALQMEIAQSAYMDERDYSFEAGKADRLRPVLKSVMAEALVAAASLYS